MEEMNEDQLTGQIQDKVWNKAGNLFNQPGVKKVNHASVPPLDKAIQKSTTNQPW